MPKIQKIKGVRDGEFIDLDPNDIDYVLDNNESLLGPRFTFKHSRYLGGGL